MHLWMVQSTDAARRQKEQTAATCACLTTTASGRSTNNALIRRRVHLVNHGIRGIQLRDHWNEMGDTAPLANFIAKPSMNLFIDR